MRRSLAQHPDHVPIGLLRKTALKRAVEPGQIITFDDIDILPSRALDIVMEQQTAAGGSRVEVGRHGPCINTMGMLARVVEHDARTAKAAASAAAFSFVRLIAGRCGNRLPPLRPSGLAHGPVARFEQIPLTQQHHASGEAYQHQADIQAQLDEPSGCGTKCSATASTVAVASQNQHRYACTARRGAIDEQAHEQCLQRGAAGERQRQPAAP